MRALMDLPPDIRARVWSAFEELAVDPYPHHLEADAGWLDVAMVKGLRRRGYDVYRLKSKRLGRYRILYFVIEDRCRVLVKEILIREADTYDLNSDHFRRIVENYENWGSLASGGQEPC